MPMLQWTLPPLSAIPHMSHVSSISSAAEQIFSVAKGGGQGTQLRAVGDFQPSKTKGSEAVGFGP